MSRLARDAQIDAHAVELLEAETGQAESCLLARGNVIEGRRYPAGTGGLGCTPAFSVGKMLSYKARASRISRA